MIFVEFNFVALLCYYNCGVILIGGLMNKKIIKILLLIWLLLIPYITNMIMKLDILSHYLNEVYHGSAIYLSMLITVLILYYEVSKKK